MHPGSLERNVGLEEVMEVLGIDVGGSGIKGAVVDTVTGELLTERCRIETPIDFQPEGVVAAVITLIGQLNCQGSVGVGFPSVVMRGVVASPPTSFQVKGWDQYPIARVISESSGCPTTVINDGDAASLAEMKFGAGRDQMGVVMMFTLGTGIGTAMFVNGHMVPNLELGHLYLPNKKKDAEYQTAERVRQEKKLSWKRWGARLNTYFNHIERLFSPDLIIIGGGVSKKHDKFLHYIKVRAKVVPAELQNEAGIIGAAVAATGA